MPSQRSRAFARLDSVQGLDKGSPPVSRRQSGRTPAGSRPAVQDPRLLGFGSWPRLKTVCFRSTPLYETEFAGASIVLYQGGGGEGNDDTTRGSSALAWNSGAGSRTGCRCLAGLFRRRQEALGAEDSSQYAEQMALAAENLPAGHLNRPFEQVSPRSWGGVRGGRGCGRLMAAGCMGRGDRIPDDVVRCVRPVLRRNEDVARI